MNENKLREILSQLGTPSYVYDLDAFNARAALIREQFGDNVGLCFSIKANAFLLGRLPDTIDKIEVCSPGELTICEKTGVDVSKIIFSGVNKTKADVERAADDNVGTFTAESFLHLQLINEAALSRGKVFPVLLRVTDVKGGSQFGMEEGDVLDLIRNRADYEGVEIVGIHYFTGTQKRKAKPILRELDYLEELVRKIKDELDFTVQRLEYGTGLAVDYFDENADELESARLADIAPRIREIGEIADLTVEMGRFFAAPCGYYFTKVIDVKTCYGVNYAIVDGGLNQLKYDGQLQGMQITSRKTKLRAAWHRGLSAAASAPPTISLRERQSLTLSKSATPSCSPEQARIPRWRAWRFSSAAKCLLSRSIQRRTDSPFSAKDSTPTYSTPLDINYA